MGKNQTSFQPGNTFHLNRTTKGREAIYNDPKVFAEACVEYLEYVKDNPRFKWELMRSGDMAGQLVKVTIERPLTEHGLCSFLKVHDKYLWELRQRCSDPEYPNAAAFTEVLDEITTIIRTDQVEGALTGEYKENLVARLNQFAEINKFGLDDDIEESLLFKARFCNESE